MADFVLTYSGSQIQGILDFSAALNTGEIKIGANAGVTAQGIRSIAIGNSAGQNNQGTNSVAIGSFAGITTQSNFSVAIGDGAASTTQGVRAVALGTDAGGFEQGNFSVAVGNLAGSISQPANSIVMSSDNVDITPATIGDILLHTTTTDYLINATSVMHNGIIVSGSDMKVGTLVAPPAGMVIDEHWLDTTDSAIHPIERVAKVAT